MLIFMLNSQLLSVAGDSEALTRLSLKKDEKSQKISKALKMGKHFRFVVFYVAISLHIYV